MRLLVDGDFLLQPCVGAGCVTLRPVPVGEACVVGIVRCDLRSLRRRSRREHGRAQNDCDSENRQHVLRCHQFLRSSLWSARVELCSSAGGCQTVLPNPAGASGSTWPPSTISVCPVMYPASGEARNRTAQPTSSGSAYRPIGIDESIRRWCSSLVSARPGVATLPGRTALTVMPLRASSTAAERMKPSMAAFDAP